MVAHEKEINKQQFESLCSIQCTQEEICSVLMVDHKTLTKWCKKNYNKSFSQVFKEKRQGGRASLRRMQWKLAENNATMGIWLGKQYLNQKDEPDKDTNQTIVVKLKGFEDQEQQQEQQDD